MKKFVFVVVLGLSTGSAFASENWRCCPPIRGAATCELPNDETDVLLRVTQGSIAKKAEVDEIGVLEASLAYEDNFEAYTFVYEGENSKTFGGPSMNLTKVETKEVEGKIHQVVDGDAVTQVVLQVDTDFSSCKRVD